MERAGVIEVQRVFDVGTGSDTVAIAAAIRPLFWPKWACSTRPPSQRSEPTAHELSCSSLLANKQSVAQDDQVASMGDRPGQREGTARMGRAGLAGAGRSGFQVGGDAARNYEAYVSRFMGPCSDRIIELARIRAGDHVLDVACGTGFVARRAAPLVGDSGGVVGVDISAAMLAAARAASTDVTPRVEWHEADAQRLPVGEHWADVVVCQQGLQFFPDPGAALAEMRRVLRPGGRLIASVWSGLSESPYFAACHAAMAHCLDADTANRFAAAFGMDDRRPLSGLLQGAGFTHIGVQADHVHVRLVDLRRFIPQHLAATPWGPALAARTSADQQTFIEFLCRQVQPLLNGDEVVAPFSYLLATGRARAESGRRWGS